MHSLVPSSMMGLALQCLARGSIFWFYVFILLHFLNPRSAHSPCEGVVVDQRERVAREVALTVAVLIRAVAGGEITPSGKSVKGYTTRISPQPGLWSNWSLD